MRVNWSRPLLGHGWWLISALLLLALLLGRAQPPLGEHLLTAGQQSHCDGSDARPVKLPSYEPGQACRRVLLRRTLAATEIHDQTLLISGVGRDLRVWVNGKLLREFDPRDSFDGTSQLLGLSLQPGILQEGDNELLIHIRSSDHPLNRSYLGVLLLGPSELLWPTYQRIWRLGAQGAQLAVLFGLGILLTLLPMAWSRPQEPAYRWFALAVLCSLIYLWHMGWPLRPLPTMLWHWVAHAALLAALWAMLRYSIVQAGPAPRLRLWVDICAVFGVVAVLLKSLLDQGWLANLGDLLFRLDMIVLLILLAGFWWQRRHADPLARWLVAAVVLNIVLGVADSLRVWSTLRGELAPYLLHWGILYLLVLLLVGQIRRILAALHTAEHAQSQLRQALAQRTLELQQEFQRRQQAEQAQTLAEERQRIMRDMHDGVGGQLVALIGQVEHGGLQPGHFRQQLRRSLDDLRLMIDSLDDACADLGVALGMLRQRLQASLQELPIQVSWRTARLPDLAPRAPDEVLQVLRIVQEAITNALRHAGCTHIVIHAAWEDERICIEVSDDGSGLSADPRQGRGLPSMRARAERIGGRIEWLALYPGTCVRLSLPQALAD